MRRGSIPRSVVESALRSNLPFFGIACIALAVGMWFFFWPDSGRETVFAEIAFAVIATPAALFAHAARPADFVNGLLIIAGTMLMLLHVVARRKDSVAGSLKWPLTVFGVLAVLTNRGFRLAGMDMEPVGFLILLGGTDNDSNSSRFGEGAEAD